MPRWQHRSEWTGLDPSTVWPGLLRRSRSSPCRLPTSLGQEINYCNRSLSNNVGNIIGNIYQHFFKDEASSLSLLARIADLCKSDSEQMTQKDTEVRCESAFDAVSQVLLTLAAVLQQGMAGSARRGTQALLRRPATGARHRRATVLLASVKACRFCTPTVV